MRIATDLARLHKPTFRRLALLQKLVEDVRQPVAPDDDRLVMFVAIESLNVWSLFCRAYFLSCALGARTLGGTRVKFALAGLTTTTQALDFAVHTMKPQAGTGPWTWRDEPTWRKPRVLMQLLAGAGASNLLQVRTAFSVPSTVFAQLPRARNFYAHRSKDTASDLQIVARAVRVPSRRSASDILCDIAPARPQTVIQDWLDEMTYVVSELCK